MAKKHYNENPKSDESSSVLPVAEPVEEPKPQLPLWKIGPKDGTAEPDLVEAETIEDAIRAYNGSTGAYSRKQLTIESA
jgi:hypothetical protein